MLVLGVVGGRLMEVGAELPRIAASKQYKEAEEDAGQLQPQDASQPNKRAPCCFTEAATAPSYPGLSLAKLFDGMDRFSGSGAWLSGRAWLSR